jgi:hypothetical protein
MIPSSACVCYQTDGPAQVDVSLRPSGDSHFQCCTYPAQPPILSIRDAHISVSVTVPDAGHVTAGDLDTANRLADALGEYITELQRHLAEHRAAVDAA